MLLILLELLLLIRGLGGRGELGRLRGDRYAWRLTKRWGTFKVAVATVWRAAAGVRTRRLREYLPRLQQDARVELVFLRSFARERQQRITHAAPIRSITGA